jgi:hypothetical protein
MPTDWPPMLIYVPCYLLPNAPSLNSQDRVMALHTQPSAAFGASACQHLLVSIVRKHVVGWLGVSNAAALSCGSISRRCCRQPQNTGSTTPTGSEIKRSDRELLQATCGRSRVREKYRAHGAHLTLPICASETKTDRSAELESGFESSFNTCEMLAALVSLWTGD